MRANYLPPGICELDGCTNLTRGIHKHCIQCRNAGRAPHNLALYPNLAEEPASNTGQSGFESQEGYCERQSALAIPR